MNIDAFYTALIILVAAAVTFGTRLLAFVIFGGRKGGEPPKWVTYLGQVLPRPSSPCSSSTACAASTCSPAHTVCPSCSASPCAHCSIYGNAMSC